MRSEPSCSLQQTPMLRQQPPFAEPFVLISCAMPGRIRLAHTVSPPRRTRRRRAWCDRCFHTLTGNGHLIHVEEGTVLQKLCTTCHIIHDLEILQGALPQGNELSIITDGLFSLWEVAREAVEEEAASMAQGHMPGSGTSTV